MGSSFFASTCGAGAGAGLGFFLAERFAASRSILPITLSPGALRSGAVSSFAGAGASTGLAGGVGASAIGAGAGAGLGAGAGATGLGATGGTTGGGGTLAVMGGGGGKVRPGIGGGGGGGGATGAAVGRVLNSRASAFCLSESAFAKASRTTSSISGVSLVVGLFSTSNPLLER